MNIATPARTGHTCALRGPWMGGADSIETWLCPQTQTHRARTAIRAVGEEVWSCRWIRVDSKDARFDVYCAGESCFEEQAQTRRSWAYRFQPEYEHFADFERAVFGDKHQVNILNTAPSQNAAYKRHYKTVESRFFELRPDLEQMVRPKDFDAGGALTRSARTASELIEGFGKGETRPVVAFCLHHFEPTDLVSRDCTDIAAACREAGYQPRIYAMPRKTPATGVMNNRLGAAASTSR